jgi:hypothetical protein
MSDGLVETDSATLKPLAQVAHDIKKGLEASAYNLKRTADAVLKEHMGVGRYDGDDLSIILVDVGVGGEEAAPPMTGGQRVQKPPTRKAKGKRRLRTEKQNRLIKIFSC